MPNLTHQILASGCCIIAVYVDSYVMMNSDCTGHAVTVSTGLVPWSVGDQHVREELPRH